MRQPTDDERLIAMMAFAMQGAQFALENSPRSVALEAALHILTIALDMEAQHWQANARHVALQHS